MTSPGPNQQALHRKWILAGGIVACFASLAAFGWFTFGRDTDEPAKPPAHQQMMRPAQEVSDKEAFTQQYANQLKTMTERLERLERLEAEFKRHRDDKSSANRPDASTGTTKPFAPVAAPPSMPIGLTPDAKRLLSTPLPGALGPIAAPIAPPITAPSVGATPMIAPPGAVRAPRIDLKPAAQSAPPTAAERDDPIRILRHESGALEDSTANPNAPKTSASAMRASATPANTAEQFVPANTFVRAALLNGLDAPTGGQAQSNPLPVALHLLDAANLPSLRRLDIRDCRILAAAFGDLSSERALLRAETVSCVLADGQVIESPIRGSVIGEDGKVGVRGRLVTKQGQVLGNALLAGIASGIGRAFTLANSTQSVTPFGGVQTVDPSRALEAGAGAGVGRALDQLANYYIRAAEKLFPVIEVDGGRVVELLVTRGATMPAQAGRTRIASLMQRHGSDPLDD